MQTRRFVQNFGVSKQRHRQDFAKMNLKKSSFMTSSWWRHVIKNLLTSQTNSLLSTSAANQ